MNLFKLFVLFFSWPALSAQIIQIDFKDASHLWRAEVAQKIMEERYRLPSIFFEKRHVKNCEDDSFEKALIHLCIENNGELVAKNINENFFKRSLSFFYLYN